MTPQEVNEASGENEPATHSQIRYIHGLRKQLGYDEEDCLNELDWITTRDSNKGSLDDLTKAEASALIEYLKEVLGV